MSNRVAERRRSQRMPAVHPAAILDEDGHFLAGGRTSSTSECGVFLLAEGEWDPALDSIVTLVLELPAAPTPRKPDKTRSVAYRARVVRTQVVGHMMGDGLELLAKVA